MRYPTLLGFVVLGTVGCAESRQAEPPQRASATAAPTITPGGTITGPCVSRSRSIRTCMCDSLPPAASCASGGTRSVADAKIGPIARARGADARTIGELWTEKSHLAGATVTIHGVVVKYNAGVMGKNWIHLQDGSGDAARGTYDIAVTTLDAAALGDTVTITGTVRTNRDVGAGYTFAVIVEEAKLTGR